MSNGVPVPGRVVLLSERGYTACSVVHNPGDGRMAIRTRMDLAVGAPVSIETIADFFVGDIVAKDVLSDGQAYSEVVYTVHLDQSISLAHCYWPQLELADRPGEAAFLQSFRTYPQTASINDEEFQASLLAICEQEKASA